MPETFGSILAAAAALRLRATARAAEISSFFFPAFSGLAFLPMRPRREGVVERVRRVKGVDGGVMLRMVGRGKVWRRAWMGREPSRLRMLNMVDIVDCAESLTLSLEKGCACRVATRCEVEILEHWAGCDVYNSTALLL